ncbi:hypothetical protein [Jidongwangia harbinensis]|uniref:hypothetical protein n=1 Tax=Jidongwangia harbinensis TaxID=2878561 RepID=UPI001CD96473|nr:hypothetical protein [Jidongwangia harbinensis]MCA2213570.1 hypothetical protein [Jidongwangia harbinensis]
MPAIAVPAFALTWWLACYLVGRDPGRSMLWRAAGALVSYAVAVAAWTIAPDGAVAQILLCVPALVWAGTAVGLLPDELPERRQIDRGWLVLSAVFLMTVAALPAEGRLVALAPLVGGLVLLWRFGDQVRPRMLPAAITAAAVLYGLGLIALLGPVDLGSPALVLAAMGLDLLLLGYLVAVADAVDSGERLLPDLRRSAVGAVVAALLAGGPAALTMLATDRRIVDVLQFALVAVVMTYAGLAGPVRRGLDRLAFVHDDRLRLDRAALLLLVEALPRRRERHHLITLSEPEFQRLTKRALDNFGDLGRLLRSPLIDLPTVDRRLTGRGAEKPLARAIELRAVLTESVARLKPPGLFGTTEEWRYYNALHYCCVRGLRPYDRHPAIDGLDADAVRAMEWFRRYVPRRRLQQWQAEGARLVAERLWAELIRTDPRWLTRAGALATPPTRNP